MSKEVLKELLDRLTVAHRMREDLIKPRVALTNQITKIMKKWKEKGTPISKEDFGLSTNEIHSEAEINFTKTMIDIAKQLPCHEWWVSVKGRSSLGLALILAETGDLSNYPNPAKVWRRMGLDVWEGEANKNKFKGMNTGYSKRRRKVAFVVANPLIQNRDNPYREIFDNRKVYEIERDTLGYNKEYVERNKSFMSRTYTTSKKKIENGQLPQCVINYRAHRYMTKRLIKDLWVEWNK